MTERVQPDRDEFAKTKRDTWNETDYGSWFTFARGEVIDRFVILRTGRSSAAQ